MSYSNEANIMNMNKLNTKQSVKMKMFIMAFLFLFLGCYTSVSYAYSKPNVISNMARYVVVSNNEILVIDDFIFDDTVEHIDFSQLAPKRSGSSIFEFFAIFNDKLQQILSFFRFSDEDVELQDTDKK